MKTTGYALREAMKVHSLNKETAEAAFQDALKAFPGETKPAPMDSFNALLKADLALALLETFQVKYNLAVKVMVQGASMTLLEAIKMAGITGRTEKLWKATIANPVSLPSYYDTDEKDATKVRAVRTLPVETAVAQTKMYGKKASALRAAIAAGNSTEIELEDLDASLFE